MDCYLPIAMPLTVVVEYPVLYKRQSSPVVVTLVVCATQFGVSTDIATEKTL